MIQLFKFKRLLRKAQKCRRYSGVLAWLLFSSSFLWAQDVQLRGFLEDFQGSRISAGTVTIKSSNSVKSIKTRVDGTFETNLEPGLYDLTATATGFCATRRAPVEISATTSPPAISFELVECALAHRITFRPGTKAVDVDEYTIPFREEILNGKAYQLKDDLHFRFGTKRRSGDMITYVPAKLSNGRQLPVVLTVGFSTFKADKITLNRRTLELELQGVIELENVKDTRQGNTMKVNLRSFAVD